MNACTLALNDDGTWGPAIEHTGPAEVLDPHAEPTPFALLDADLTGQPQPVPAPHVDRGERGERQLFLFELL